VRECVHYDNAANPVSAMSAPPDVTIAGAGIIGLATAAAASQRGLTVLLVGDLRALFDTYPNAGEIVWVQEEPENMGAWDFIRPHLQEVSSGRTVRRVARPRSASPAEGSAARHALNQKALMDQAFADPGGPRADGDRARKAQLTI
jgi:2-polyprenyl-6-methoxyphenol hydroxylase-like FAD-dependent oxidoreductase